jgi:hypothetical protein
VQRILIAFVSQGLPIDKFRNADYIPFSPLTNLDLGGASLGELEVDVAASESSVNLRIGVESVVNATTLLLVEDDLEELAAVLLGADALADDLDGEGEISQDGVVDGGQGAGTGTLLLLGVAGAGRALGAGEDAARSQDEDVAVGELLLQLTGQAADGISLSSSYLRNEKSLLTAAEHGGSPAGKGRGQR